MYNSNANMIEQAVQVTLERLGYTSGLISYTQAKKVYGRWFTELVKLGAIRPIVKGKGRNGMQQFQVSDILAKIDEAKRQAYAELI